MKYIILAGGSGTRLWPLSRKNYAKQFLQLTNNYSMLQNTAMRVSKQNGSDVYVIANSSSSSIIDTQLKEVLPDFDNNNMLIEPEARNTAPAIIYGAMHFNDDDIVAILSSDHHIGDEANFNKILSKAEKISKDGYIVTLGIKPTSPETAYGYIKKSNDKILGGYIVDKFVEKPVKTTAQQYLEDGGYFWNAGIFIFKISVFFEELKKHAPSLYNTYIDIKNKATENPDDLSENYRNFEKISIDYALMEKSKKIVVIKSDFKWNDIGSFKSLYEILPKDKNGNFIKSNDARNIININSNDNMIIAGNRKIATIGLKDLIIIDTDDALLISKVSDSEKVKDAVEKLGKIDAPEIKDHIISCYSWGKTRLIEENNHYTILEIILNKNKEIIIEHIGFQKCSVICSEGQATIKKFSKNNAHESIILQSESIEILNFPENSFALRNIDNNKTVVVLNWVNNVEDNINSTLSHSSINIQYHKNEE